jgi:hypothetical protein
VTDWSSRLLLYAGLPASALFTLAIHAWTVVIAGAGAGAREAAPTNLTPVWSWVSMALLLRSATRTWASNYTVCLGVWFLSALLMAGACLANRWVWRPKPHSHDR